MTQEESVPYEVSRLQVDNKYLRQMFFTLMGSDFDGSITVSRGGAGETVIVLYDHKTGGTVRINLKDWRALVDRVTISINAVGAI